MIIMHSLIVISQLSTVNVHYSAIVSIFSLARRASCTVGTVPESAITRRRSVGRRSLSDKITHPTAATAASESVRESATGNNYWSISDRKWHRIPITEITKISKEYLTTKWRNVGDNPLEYTTIRTRNSRTDSRRIFKLRGGVDDVTRYV